MIGGAPADSSPKEYPAKPLKNPKFPRKPTILKMSSCFEQLIDLNDYTLNDGEKKVDAEKVLNPSQAAKILHFKKYQFF